MNRKLLLIKFAPAIFSAIMIVAVLAIQALGLGPPPVTGQLPRAY
jgi:hypothetical protein